MIDTNDEKTIDVLINSLGVFELRGVARQLGIASPTTKKREELISLIQEAINSGATVKDSTPKRGRPFKKLNILDSITNKISNEVVKLDFSNTKKALCFGQDNRALLDMAEFEGIIIKYSLYIEMRDIVTGTLVKFEKTEQLDELLETGDKVRATANLVEGVYYASRIMKINDVAFDEYRSIFVDKMYPIIDDTKIEFAQTKAVVGRRNLFKLNSELFETNYVENLLDYCQNEGYELIILAVNTSYENEIKLNMLPTSNKFISAYGSSNDLSYHKVLDAVNYAENLVDRGKRVILFTADIIEAVRCLDKHFAFADKNEENYEEATLLVTQKLLRFARAYKQGCNGTLILCYNSIDAEDKFLVNDIMKISNRLN